MTGAFETIVAALTPVQRFSAAARGHPAPMVSWTVWVPVFATVVLGASLIYIYRRYVARREAFRALLRAIDDLDLNNEESGVLMRVAALAGPGRAVAVLNSAEEFERGVSLLMASRPVAAMSAEGRAHLAAIVDSVRGRLGFSEAAPQSPAGSARPPLLQPGLHVTVVRRGSPPRLTATVLHVDGKNLGLEMPPVVEVGLAEAWRIRCSSASVQWEFDGVVHDSRQGYAQVRLMGEPRCVNLRRFVRVPTRKRAWLAQFPFKKDPRQGDKPEFAPATVTEMAGPGLRIDSTIRAEVGDRMIVVVCLRPDTMIQGICKVRRTIRGDDGLSVVAVEMVGLSDGEVAQLVHETNLIARRADAAEADADRDGEPRDEMSAPVAAGESRP